MIYSVYSGERVLRVEHTDDLVLGEGEGALEGDYPPTDYYMVGGLPMPRPSFDLALSESVGAGGVCVLPAGAVLRIDGLPVGVRVVDPSGDFIESDGWYEASFSHAGRFVIAFDKFPYKEVEIYVVAGA